MGALIVIDVHARDAVSDLINKGTWGRCSPPLEVEAPVQCAVSLRVQPSFVLLCALCCRRELPG
jgi:hypothetical protein